MPAEPPPTAPPGTDLLADAGWECLGTAPGTIVDPAGLAAATAGWMPARVPGTVASALREAGHWDGLDSPDLDGQDWWFRCRLGATASEGRWLLQLGGLATVADVWLDGEPVLHSEDMFLAHEVMLATVGPAAELVVRCAALTPLLSPPRRPRARWRSTLVPRQELRWWRTSLLGRIPGVAGTAAPVGPWRGVRLVPEPAVRIIDRQLGVRLDAGQGLVSLDVRVRTRPAHATGSRRAVLHVGDVSTEFALHLEGDDLVGSAQLRLPRAAPWWPHTHGDQPGYPARLEVDGHPLDLGGIGFRTLEVDRSAGGFRLLVNGVAVFLRGACWVPPDVVSLAADASAVTAALQQLVAAGMNVVRVTGTAVYEDEHFWRECDRLGLLVWQDAMLATLDYPSDEAFLGLVEQELRQILSRAQGHPALAVLSGGSETEQQPELLGLAPGTTGGGAVTGVLAAVAAELVPGVPVVTSSPTGGVPVTRADVGVSHWFGVGAYRRPLSDTRAAGVRFAAECLALSNPPERSTVEQACGGAVRAGHDPRWKLAVPRDPTASWDFEDVRDHYVRLLFGVDPAQLRSGDPERALDLGRATVAELMAAVLTELRRPGSVCGGAVVLSLRDTTPGAGWGLVDAFGRPKAPWWSLRRVLAPVALLLIDEGLNGVDLHAVNDRPSVLDARVLVELFARGETLVASAEREVSVPAHGTVTLGVEEVLGGFRDVGYAYRFGPPSHDVVAASLLAPDSSLLSQVVHLPHGLARAVEADIGVSGEIVGPPGAQRARLRSRRFAQGVVVEVPGHHVEDAWFPLLPGATRELVLTPETPAWGARGASSAEVRALNAALPVRLAGAT